MQNKLVPCVLYLFTIGSKEGNDLFNDTLKTFYLWLYGIRHMVKDHSGSEIGNPLLPHMPLFRLAARVLLYASSHRQDNTYHGLWYASHGMNALTTELHLAPLHNSVLDIHPYCQVCILMKMG